MKKILLSLFLFAIILIPIQAKENRLYFTQDGKRLYYESKYIEDIFMNHNDMVPGKSYTDELIIENATKTTYTLYFKVVPQEIEEEKREFMKNIFMKIYLEDQLIYDGKATGLDYLENGTNLQDAVCLGDFTPASTSRMVVETKLSESYDNMNQKTDSLIEWSFYGEYDDSGANLINPNTYSQGSSHNWTLLIIVSLLIVLLLSVAFQRKKVMHK